MTIHEFAKTYCSDILRVVNSKSIYEQIIEKDNLPYEDIRIDEETGLPTKVIYLDDSGRFIDIYELITYSEEDIKATKDTDLIQAYEIYISMIDTQELSISDTLRLAKEWRSLRDKEEANAGLLS